MDFKTTLVGSDDGAIYKIDTIEHEGALWLVPIWVEVINPVGQEPGRAIRLTGLDYDDAPQEGIDFYLKMPIPKAILDGITPPEKAIGFVVVDRPIDDRLARKN